ncbi:hypothetical protein K7X08_011665 [Anisodus acutangulus]|uniref:Protein kinase domain-containing protein n=1 Tax=Anisodus acutangulus TaxID=402998 RepID=A0A9Q1ML52_9SOLA|nr:hypothetical protein K7X08_011665 [Anisodus acutangulus]
MADQKEEILSTRRKRLNPRLSRGVPKGIESEQVAAGWPNWLVAVAGESLNGWLPRRPDTFEKMDKIGQGTYSNLLKGLDHCHSCGILHRDVKTSNLLPNASIFKPQMPYRRQIQATYHDLPAAAVGLMDTLLSIEPEHRGTADLALQGEFFTTEPFSCDPSSLPQSPPPPSKEIDAKRTEIKGCRDRNYARDRSLKEIPAAEANADLQRSIDRRRLLNHSKARNRLEETNEYISGGTNSSASFQESSRKEGSDNYTQSSATHQRDDQRTMRKEPIHDDHDSKGKKKWPSPLPGASDNMQDLLREHEAMILKAVTSARFEKGTRERRIVI